MSALQHPEPTTAPPRNRPGRPRIRLAGEPADPERLAEVRIVRRVLAYLRGAGAARPRSASEVYSYANISGMIRTAKLGPLLETLVARGVLVGHDGIVAGYRSYTRRPFRGYTAAAPHPDPTVAPEPEPFDRTPEPAIELIPCAAWDSLRERVVAHVRAVAFRVAGAGVRPTLEQLVQETGLHRKTIRAARGRLMDTGQWPERADVDRDGGKPGADGAELIGAGEDDDAEIAARAAAIRAEHQAEYAALLAATKRERKRGRGYAILDKHAIVRQPRRGRFVGFRERGTFD